MHPQTGAAQIVEMVERVEEVVKKVEKEPPLFSGQDPDYLLALGVPSEWLDAVKLVTENAFESLAAHLPQEAAERLLRLACGDPVPRPAAVAVANPFDHPDAQRRFRVMDDQDELRRWNTHGSSGSSSSTPPSAGLFMELSAARPGWPGARARARRSSRSIAQPSSPLARARSPSC